MDEFVRRARVRRPEPDKTLTLNEASYVMCDIAIKNNIKTSEEFLRFMFRAWTAYNILNKGD